MFRVRVSSAFRLFVAGSLLLLIAVPSAAQPSPPTDLAAIEKALLRIADILDQQSRQTHATLLLSRLEIENRDLRSLDDAVASNRSSLRQARLEEQRQVEHLERVRDFVDQDSVPEEERLQARRQLEIDEAQLESLQANRSDLEQRVIELENEAYDAALRRDALRAQVDEVLGVDQRGPR